MDYFFKDVDQEIFAWDWFKPSAVSQRSLKSIKYFIDKSELLEAGFYNHSADEDLVNEDFNSFEDIRSTKIAWLSDGHNMPDILKSVYEELTTLSRSVNDHLWKYCIEGWESFQYAEYRSEERGHYNWHVDTTPRFNGGNVRKLTFVVGLSHKHEYDGGELQLRHMPEPVKFKLGKGDFVIFPSFLLHRVTPVTRGVRKTLVGWGRGPNFV